MSEITVDHGLWHCCLQSVHEIIADLPYTIRFGIALPCHAPDRRGKSGSERDILRAGTQLALTAFMSSIMNIPLMERRVEGQSSSRTA